VENSSQDVSPFAEMEVCVVEGTKVELAFMISETTFDGLGDEPFDDRKLKMGGASSGVATEELDGDGGGTAITWGTDERRISG
jgi:hypothetical protein